MVGAMRPSLRIVVDLAQEAAALDRRELASIYREGSTVDDHLEVGESAPKKRLWLAAGAGSKED